VAPGWGYAMQAASVHIDDIERPEERILNRLGPEKDDLRTVRGEVHRVVGSAKRVSRQTGEISSVGPIGYVDTISFVVGILPACARHLLAVGRPNITTEVQRRVGDGHRLGLGPIRTHDRCCDSLAVRSVRRPRDLGSVRREAGAARFSEAADALHIGPVRLGREDRLRPTLPILAAYSGEEDLALKVRRPRL
jgi:hypothetical protein